MTEKFVLLVSFNFPSEMFVLKTKLESDGIDCFVSDENTVSANPFLANAIGGVKLKVKTEDAERAIKVMNAFYKNETDGNEEISYEENLNADQAGEALKNNNESKVNWLIILLILIAISLILVISFY